ncbi:hypothetical protein IIC68_00800 [archaeon]|nr:hypothetical protein [archaeon]
MKKLLILPALLLLISIGFAATIDSPSSVPANVSWGFTVNLDGASTTTVTVNDSTIVTVNSNGTITSNPFNGQYVWNPGSDIIYVSHFGLDEGTHSITVESDSGNDSKEISAFKALDSSFKTELETSIISTVDERLEGVDQQFLNQDVDNKEFWKKINENESNITSLTSQIDSEISSATDSLNSDVSSLDSRLKVLEVINAEEIAAQLAVEEAEREAARLAEEESQNSPVIGFFSLARDLAIPIAVLVIIVVLGIVAFLAKDKIGSLGSIYSSKMDDDNLSISDDDQEIMGDAMKANSKWGYEDK